MTTSYRSIVRGGGAAALVLMVLAGTAHGQNVFNPLSDTGWMVTRGGGVTPPPDPFWTFSRTGNTTAPGFRTDLTPAPPPAGTIASATANLGLRGTATHDNNAGADQFGYSLRTIRTFSMAEDGTIAMPHMLNGRFTIGGAANVAAVSGSARLDYRLYRETGNNTNVYNQVFATNVNDSLSGADDPLFGNQFNLSTNWLAPTFNVDAGPRRYRVEMILRIDGTAFPGGNPADVPNGASVNVNFSSVPGQRNGAVGSIAFTPRAVNFNSRDAIFAGAGREQFGVTGRNVEVGVLEQGESYTNHTSLAAGRFSFEYGPGNSPAATGRSYKEEHTLAVTSIIGSVSNNSAESGIAPGVTFRGADITAFATGFDAFDRLLARGTRIINMSAGEDGMDQAGVDTRLFNNPNVTLVNAANNDGLRLNGAGDALIGQDPTTNTNTNPTNSWNLISVGGLNRDGTRRADFSSFNGTAGGPSTPALVAPAEYILAANLQGSDGTNAANNFGRIFMGDSYDRWHGASPSTGDISGNSFAAPMVSGTVALMHEYAAKDPARYDGRAIDQRVMKALLINGASTDGITGTKEDLTAGAAWKQTASGDGTFFNRRQITHSLDTQLGGGKLDTYNALRNFASGEISQSDDNTNANKSYDGEAYTYGGPLSAPGQLRGLNGFWDLENVKGNGGRVNYLMGDLIGNHLRTTLVWDANPALAPGGSINDILANLTFTLFSEGTSEFNVPGWDVGDVPLIEAFSLDSATAQVTQNVLLIDWIIKNPDGDGPSTLPLGAERKFFLSVLNSSTFDAEFAISVQVPTPGVIGLLGVAGVLAARRRRS